MGMTISQGQEVSDRSASTVGEAAGIFAKILSAWELRSYHFSIVP